MIALRKEHKTLLIIMVIGVILLEVEIFAFSAMKAGRKSVLGIRDQQGNRFHVTDGNNLSTFNKYYFEQIFGPLIQKMIRSVSFNQTPKHRYNFPVLFLTVRL
jgi:hypothetical protein